MYHVHLCRIEAAEKKHHKEWEEDWGSKEKSKTPSRSPSSSPQPPAHRSPSPKPKTSSKLTTQAFKPLKCMWFEWFEQTTPHYSLKSIKGYS